MWARLSSTITDATKKLLFGKRWGSACELSEQPVAPISCLMKEKEEYFFGDCVVRRAFCQIIIDFAEDSCFLLDDYSISIEFTLVRYGF